MSDLLKNLKDALEKGEFNSDAAMKINEITAKVEEYKPNGADAEEKYSQILENVAENATPVTEEEVKKTNEDYDKYMYEVDMENKINHLLYLGISKFDSFESEFKGLEYKIMSIDEVLKKYDEFETKYPNHVEIFTKKNKKIVENMMAYKEVYQIILNTLKEKNLI